MSRRYLRNPYGVAWTLTPRCSSGAYPFLPERQRPRHRDKQLGTPGDPCQAISTGGQFRGCSHSLMFRLHHSLGPQIAPTARPRCVLGGRAIYTRPNLGTLPTQSTGIATCLKRATGTAGLTPAGSRPCRLLLSLLAIRFCSEISFLPKQALLEPRSEQALIGLVQTPVTVGEPGA